MNKNEKSPTLVTKAEYARRQGVSRQYIDKLLRQEVLRETDKKIDENEANRIMSARRAMTTELTRIATADLSDELLRARLNNEIEKGKLLKLETAEKEKSLISTDMVKDTLFRKGRVVRDAMLNIPDRVSSVLSAMNDPREIHELLTKEIRLALEELSNNNG